MSGRVTVDIAIASECWRVAAPDAEALCRRCVEAALRGRIPSSADTEVSLLLSDDDAVAALNAQYRGKVGPTNVLSFPAFDEPAAPAAGLPFLLGDVVLAAETVIAEARASGTALRDHVAHLVVHGTLHLLGYDHETDEEAVEMETLEAEILSQLGVDNPYEEDRAAPAKI